MIALLLSANTQIFAENEQYGSNTSISATVEERIYHLIDERALLLNEMNLCDVSEEQFERRLMSIDDELESLGVEFLDYEQVCHLFPDSKANKELAFSGNTQEKNDRIDPPSSNKNYWMSYRSTYTAGNTSFDIQRLIAQGSSNSSPLLSYGTATKTYNANWTAGTTNVIKSIASALIGSIQEASAYVTFYELLSAFVSGVSTTTVVTAPHIAYTWSNATTAVFTYVRKSFQSDAYQYLSQVSTKTQTAVSYNIPSFKYQNTGGPWMPIVVYGNTTMYNTPVGYDNIPIAVSIFNTMSNTDKREVWYVNLKGPQDSPVYTIYPLCPSIPSDCE